MEALHYFASVLHTKLGTPDYDILVEESPQLFRSLDAAKSQVSSLQLASATHLSGQKQSGVSVISIADTSRAARREDDECASGEENVGLQAAKKRAIAASPGSSSFHRQIMAARNDEGQLDALLSSIKGEDMLAELQAQSAEIVLSRVKAFVRSADEKTFQLGAIILQNLARFHAPIFATRASQSAVLACLRALENATPSPLFGTGECRQLIAFLRESSQSVLVD